MAALGSKATNKIASMLAGGTGLGPAIGRLAAQEQVERPEFEASAVIAQQVSHDVAEKSAGVKYPAFYVYCEGMKNLLREKFRTFSGKAQMAVEVRMTHDRLEGVSEALDFYTAAVCEVLEVSRGDWADGMFYTGGYEVEFGPIKHGGSNFVKTAKIRFDVEVSY